MMGLRTTTHEALLRLGRPVDAASLVVFRVAFGAIMLWEVCRYLSSGWVRRYWIDPVYHFTYPGFDWVHPWPGDGMIVHFYALGLLAISIAAGAAYRIATTLFFLGFTYVFLLERAQYLNHFYFICLISFLLILVPAHRAFSVDALLYPGLRSGVVPAWAVWLLRFQVGIPYFFGGIAKLDGDWLRGEPMRRWLANRTDDFPVIGSWFTEEWMVSLMNYGGVLFDLLVVPALLWRRSRPFAFAAALMFHLMNARLFQIGIFPWFMIAATTIFFEPDWPRRLLRRRSVTAAAAAAPAPLRPLLAAFLAAYATLQVLVPLRQHLHPGDTNWTEQGRTFSWQMKMRNKKGSVTFFAIDKATGRRWQIRHQRYLSPRQYSKMATRPYMIRQFCAFLADMERRRGRDVEIRVNARATLNGREYQRLIDPGVDLAAEPYSLRSAKWIIPLETPLRRQSPGALETEPE